MSDVSEQQVAQHFLGFFFQDQGGWKVADNAPSALWRFVFSIPRNTDVNLIRGAVNYLATGQEFKPPGTQAVLRWLANHSDMIEHGNELLQQKVPPKDFESLVKKMYWASYQDVLNSLRKFIRENFPNSK